MRRGNAKALLAAGLLLAGDGALGSLAGTRVRLGALAVHGQATTVTDALVAADLDLAADVGGDLAAEVTLHLPGAFDVVAERDELVVGQVLDADVAADPGDAERLEGAGTADAVDVREGDLHALIARDVDAGKTCHVWLLLGETDRRCGALPVPGPPTRGVPHLRGLWNRLVAIQLCDTENRKPVGLRFRKS